MTYTSISALAGLALAAQRGSGRLLGLSIKSVKQIDPEAKTQSHLAVLFTLIASSSSDHPITDLALLMVGRERERSLVLDKSSLDIECMKWQTYIPKCTLDTLHIIVRVISTRRTVRLVNCGQMMQLTSLQLHHQWIPTIWWPFLRWHDLEGVWISVSRV
jgi:hypothetical protein